MAKKPAARKTPEQLKSAVWPDRESAMRDLKASRMSERGDDYELREYRPGSWQLVSPNDKADPIREDRVLGALRKKPGLPPRAPVNVIAFTKDRAKAKAEAPAKAKPKAKAAPKTHVARMSAASFKEAVKSSMALLDVTPDERPAPEPEAPKPEPEAPKPEPVPEAPPKPVSLFSPLPKEGQPYELVIKEGAYPWHSTHTAALTLASGRKREPCVVHVRNSHGEIVRTYDPAELKRIEAANKPKRAAPGRAAVGESKFSRAARLLFREQGATARELERECGWENVSQRYVNRASKFNDNATIETLGEKHWRLIKRK